ncbi:MAG: acyl-CoA thioesterase [Eubacteriales bacterium]
MKKISESHSILSEVMLPSQANPAGTVHGGEIMKMMDTCAGVAAMRHCKSNAVTARVNELEFYQSIRVGQLVICEANLVYTGNTSMEIKVTVKIEDLTSETPQKIALTAFFTFVALDESCRPIKVPQLITETDCEKRDYEAGRLRHEAYKALRAVNMIKPDCQ